jgi:hypothetical protein
MKTQTRTIALSIVTMLLLICPAQTAGGERPDAILPAPAEAVLQPAATVSGTIRHSGSPVSGVVVTVVWDGGSQESITGPSGEYSVSGVPTGGWIQIFVRPPIADRLAFRNWGTDSLTGDLVKDFDLESGYRLQGEFRRPDGTLYAQGFWLGTNPVDFSPPAGEWVGDGAQNGQFDLVVGPGIYTLKPGFQPPPYHMPHTKVDMRSSDHISLVVTLLDEPPTPFPTTPPDASKITVGDPDVEGYATVTGAAGAVEPLSMVALVNLSAHTVMTATSDASGAFTAALYAPPGSSLLVKYDFYGDRARRLWQDAFAHTLAEPSYLNPLPGTILYVGAPPAGDGSAQAFHSVGSWQSDGTAWAGWWLSGTLQVPAGGSGPGLTVQAGQPVTLTARLRVTSPALNCTGTPTPTADADILLRYLFGTNGRSEPWDIWFNSHLFTPTGLPIEHEASGEKPHMAADLFTSLSCVSSHAFEGTAEIPFTIPADLPDGMYRPELLVWSDTPLSDDVPLVTVWYHLSNIARMVPPLIVGDPAVPRIPWTLLGDYPVNGHRGLQAREDVGHFAMPTRVLFPPHQVVVPRLDERTGKPLVYRLEPGSHWLAASERRMPNPPHIPLAFPSGSLTVEVRKPNGSVDTLGPAQIRQPSVRTPTTPGGNDLHKSTGQISDLYHLTTLNEAFDYSFEQYGPHVITLSGEVDDIYGNTYAIEGTYDVTVARVLDLDPAQLPTTPYEQEGDAFAPGLHIFPPVPADVTVQLVEIPYSDPTEAITTTVAGRANRFGYFQPQAGPDRDLTAPGEFRVDISAVYTDTDGTLWAGYMTWGNVVEGPGAQIEAHGRRGMDYKSNKIDDMPVWFEVFNLPPSKVGIENFYPHFSGDVHWGNEDRVPGDSIHSVITIKDLTGPSETIYNTMQDHFPRAKTGYHWPPTECTPTGLISRTLIGEAPLFITTRSGIDPAVDPDDIDLWGYWYGSSERPDVRVREIVSEDNMGTPYWRFDDTYAYQIGEPADGDQPGDIKWEFGGAVFRVISETNPINEYAIYSSLWVLLPHDDPVGARVTPPFQDATGAGINGGPILTMTVQGEVQEIDMLFLPKGVRPGDVLEVGDVVAFSGHVGPPLDSRVSVTITSPGGTEVHARTWHASKIGWLYDPAFDFVANEAGRWTVDVSVLHDRPYVGNGVIPQSHNSGTVMGTTGRYEFYVVEPDSSRLWVTSPQPGFITWSSGYVEPVHIRGRAPAGTTAVRYTIHDKGVVMGQGSVTPDAGGAFTVTYDAKALHEDFSMLSLTAHEGIWEGLADEVAINLLAVGGDEPRGNTVTLIGEEVFIYNDVTLHSIYLPLIIKGG